jgi:hypothetical protein
MEMKSQLQAPAALLLGNEHLITTEYNPEWAPGLVQMFLRGKFLLLPDIDIRFFGS